MRGIARDRCEGGNEGGGAGDNRASREVHMLCAELEKLESEFDDILSALENPNLTEQEKKDLREAYARMSQAISNHQKSGHAGGPCYEE